MKYRFENFSCIIFLYRGICANSLKSIKFSSKNGKTVQYPVAAQTMMQLLALSTLDGAKRDALQQGNLF